MYVRTANTHTHTPWDSHDFHSYLPPFFFLTLFFFFFTMNSANFWMKPVYFHKSNRSQGGERQNNSYKLRHRNKPCYLGPRSERKAQSTEEAYSWLHANPSHRREAYLLNKIQAFCIVHPINGFPAYPLSAKKRGETQVRHSYFQRAGVKKQQDALDRTEVQEKENNIPGRWKAERKVKLLPGSKVVGDSCFYQAFQEFPWPPHGLSVMKSKAAFLLAVFPPPPESSGLSWLPEATTNKQ